MSALPRPRRQTTACSSCRNRRVKCSRHHPSCLQCSKRKQLCEYVDVPPVQIEFIAETINSGPSSSKAVSVPPETWKSEPRAATKDSSFFAPCSISIFGEKEIAGEDGFEGASKANDGGEWGFGTGHETQALGAQHESIRVPPVDPAIQIGSLGDPFLSTLFRGLAPRDEYHQHFENYISTIHPILPLCDIGTLHQTYSQFWETLSFSTSAELLTLVLAILYTGAANAISAVETNTSSTLLALYDILVAALELPTYHVKSLSTSLWLLQGVVIMNTFKASKLPPFTAYGFLPAAIRFAQSLKVHVDQGTDARTATKQLERLWQHLLYLDIESSIASGLPSIIRPSRSSQSQQIIEALSPTGEHSTPMELAMKGHWLWTSRMHIWLDQKPDQHEINHFKRLMQGLLLRIVPDSDGHEWASLYLKWLVDRIYCMIGLQNWQVGQVTGTSCHSEIVMTSRSFLDKFLRLAAISKTQGTAWFLPSLVQPIHALMILLMHLNSCSHNAEESELSRNLIDQVFSLRAGKILNDTHRAPTPAPEPPQMYNARYRALTVLRLQVWKRMDWPLPSPTVAQTQPGVIVGNSAAMEQSLFISEEITGPQKDDQMLFNDPLLTAMWPEPPHLDAWFNSFQAPQ